MKKYIVAIGLLCLAAQCARAQTTVEFPSFFIADSNPKVLFRSNPSKAVDCVIEFDAAIVAFGAGCDLYSQPGAIKARDAGGSLSIQRK